MIALLAKIFIKDAKAFDDPKVRRSYGALCASVAIALNLLLSVVKFILAHFAEAFAIRADAVNNMTDALGSLGLMLAFHFAGARPRRDRPFGNGRIEYVAGLLISALIVAQGLELAKDSFFCILRPTELLFSQTTVYLLLASIGVKCYMSYFFTTTGKKIDSDALKASGLDSLSDTIATFAALLSLLIFHLSNGRFNLDGWFGLLVSLLIFQAGFRAMMEAIRHLLGTPPDPHLVEKVVEICMDCKEVVGVHDLVVHDYGPGRLHISVHCEVSGDENIYLLHESIDAIMGRLDKTLGCESVVHMDPVCVDDERVATMRDELQRAIAETYPTARIHDFRLKGKERVLALFDCVVPYDLEPDDEKAKAKVKEIAKELWKDSAVPIVKLERSYI